MSVKTIGEVSFGGGGEDYELPVDAPMSDAENAEYTQLEAVIAEHQQTFVKVGLALLTIRDKKLYRSQFPTFEKYCDTKWGFTARRAYQICAGAEVVENLRTSGSQTLPTTERQVRPLTKLKGEDQVNAWASKVNGDAALIAEQATHRAAAIVGVHVEVVKIAKKIKDKSPETFKKVASGEITISEAVPDDKEWQLKPVFEVSSEYLRRTFFEWLIKNRDQFPEIQPYLK